jgi:hypothetical protein
MKQDRSKYKKQKMTLLLDSETIDLIRSYGQDILGSTSVSASVRAMAKEYGRKKYQNTREQ